MLTFARESGPTPERRGNAAPRTDAAKVLMGYLIMGFFFLAGAPLAAQAAKPVDEAGVPFGNGFPSGAHFNLNMIGKKANFTCPAPEYDEYGAQVYGKVIFIPRDQGTDPINILVESGKKGPKNAVSSDTLAVTDWCTESFADSGGPGMGDPAIFQLPANGAGYAVYARITGKPGDGDVSASFSTSLYYVEDEAGNDLLLLGLVDRDGLSTFEPDGTITRTSTSTKGKGVKKAVNITGLFTWSGEVCYLQEDTSDYCLADDGVTDICSTLGLCCVDPDSDGIYDRCDLLTVVGELEEDGTTLICPETDTDDNLYTFVEAQCRTFSEEWVFNIADFVGVLWNLDNNGSYVIQIRFYPL